MEDDSTPSPTQAQLDAVFSRGTVPPAPPPVEPVVEKVVVEADPLDLDDDEEDRKTKTRMIKPESGSDSYKTR